MTAQEHLYILQASMSGIAGVNSEPIGEVRNVYAQAQELKTSIETDDNANISGTPNSRTLVTHLNDPLLTVYDVVQLIKMQEPPMATGYVNSLRASMVYHRPDESKHLGIEVGSAIKVGH